MRINNISPAFTGAYAFETNGPQSVLQIRDGMNESIESACKEKKQKKAGYECGVEGGRYITIDTPNVQWSDEDRAIVLAGAQKAFRKGVSESIIAQFYKNIERTFEEKPKPRIYVPYNQPGNNITCFALQYNKKGEKHEN